MDKVVRQYIENTVMSKDHPMPAFSIKLLVAQDKECDKLWAAECFHGMTHTDWWHVLQKEVRLATFALVC